MSLKDPRKIHFQEQPAIQVSSVSGKRCLSCNIMRFKKLSHDNPGMDLNTTIAVNNDSEDSVP
jgi:hypothetical protein